jgi:hypothetical protein
MASNSTNGAGAQLRKTLEDALDRQSKVIGRTLEWSEDEQAMLEAACNAANRAEDMRNLYAAERSGENRATILVKLSAELRMLDRQIVELVARINVGLGPAKSARHQRAADARWARERSVRGTA